MSKRLSMMMLLSCAIVSAAAFAAEKQNPPPLISNKPMALAVYQYTAETSAAVKPGVVSAGGASWSCSGSRCTSSGPWPAPSVAMCHALAVQVGPIKSFGHSNKTLNAAELQQCNAGVNAGAAKPQTGFASIPIDKGNATGDKPPAAKPGDSSDSKKPSGFASKSASDSSGPILITTSRIAAVATGVIPTLPIVTVINVRTSRIAAVSTGVAPTAPTPIVINVRTETINARATGVAP